MKMYTQAKLHENLHRFIQLGGPVEIIGDFQRVTNQKGSLYFPRSSSALGTPDWGDQKEGEFEDYVDDVHVGINFYRNPFGGYFPLLAYYRKL